MNVPQTQYSLARSADIGAIVGVQQDAADQIQRQRSLEASQDSARAAASVAQAQGAAESRTVGDRPSSASGGSEQAPRRRRRNDDQGAAVNDALNPGPLGHRLDIIA